MKYDVEKWDSNFIHVLKASEIMGKLVIMFCRTLREPLDLAHDKDGWLKMREALAYNRSLRAIQFGIVKHEALCDDQERAFDLYLETTFQDMENHPTLKTVSIFHEEGNTSVKAPVTTFRSLIQRNPNITLLVDSSHVAESKDAMYTVCKPALMENRLWPKFTDTLSDSAYAHAMVRRARRYPSLFYRCLRHRSFLYTKG